MAMGLAAGAVFLVWGYNELETSNSDSSASFLSNDQILKVWQLYLFVSDLRQGGPPLQT